MDLMGFVVVEADPKQWLKLPEYEVRAVIGCDAVMLAFNVVSCFIIYFLYFCMLWLGKVIFYVLLLFYV